MIDQIRKLKDAGHPIKKICVILGISRNTVRRYLRSYAEIQETKGKEPTPKSLPWMIDLDWDQICEKRRKGFTAKQLFDEFEPKISYSTFCTRLRESLGTTAEISLRLQHNPGEKCQVDFCDGIFITDHKTGKKTKTHLFVGILPFSSYCFGTFVLNQKLETFIRAHESMWHYFGGVTPYVVIDNLKAGVKKAHRYDPIVNPTYCDYGNHSKFAVLPARPYTPRDKAAVEANIGVIQRSFFQQARQKSYYSLSNLNNDFRKFLNNFNKQIMKDYGVSRRDRFEVERPNLISLPEIPYEISEWRSAKVHPDCCIQIGKCFYSVPFQYRSRQVRVKITDHLISIFSEDTELLASHKRAHKIGSVVSNTSHFPEKLVQQHSFDVKSAIEKSKIIGPVTEKVVEMLLSGERPLRYLRRVQGLLRLHQQGFKAQDIEYASSQALTYSKYNLSFIKSCAQQHQLTGGRLKTCRPQRDPDQIYLRGGYDV